MIDDNNPRWIIVPTQKLLEHLSGELKRKRYIVGGESVSRVSGQIFDLQRRGFDSFPIPVTRRAIDYVALVAFHVVRKTSQVGPGCALSNRTC